MHSGGWWALIGADESKGKAKVDRRLLGRILIYAQPYWGKGLATESARAALAYGFEKAGLDRIMAVAVPENVASQRVMQKIGMTGGDITTAYYGGAELISYLITRKAFYALSTD